MNHRHYILVGTSCSVVFWTHTSSLVNTKGIHYKWLIYRGKDRKNIASGSVTKSDTGEKPLIVWVKYATRQYRFHSKQNDSQHVLERSSIGFEWWVILSHGFFTRKHNSDDKNDKGVGWWHLTQFNILVLKLYVYIYIYNFNTSYCPHLWYQLFHQAWYAGNDSWQIFFYI